MSGITVVEVFRSIGFEPVKPHTWVVGIAIAKLYIDENGVEPPKENRRKTCGKGVHCFAIYPESYRSRIVKKIRSVMGYSQNVLTPAQTPVQSGLF